MAKFSPKTINVKRQYNFFKIIGCGARFGKLEFHIQQHIL